MEILIVGKFKIIQLQIWLSRQQPLCVAKYLLEIIEFALFSPTLLLFKFNLAKVVEYAIYLSNQL
jgi:hypothetical protein